MTQDRPPLADEQLDALLDTLPRENVPADFAPAVARRIDARRRRSARGRALVAAAVVAALGTSTWLSHDHRSRRTRATQEAAMRLELRQLGAELEQLERQGARARPVVLLGTTQDVDIVVDLYRLATGRARGRDTASDPPPNDLTFDHHPAFEDDPTNAPPSGAHTP